MRLITLLFLFTLITYPASADDDPGFYVGASVGQASLDGTATGTLIPSLFAVDDEDTLWGLTVGYDAGKWFSLEFQYVDLGEAPSTNSGLPIFAIIGPGPINPPTVVPVIQSTASVRGLTLSGLAEYEFAQRFSVYGRAGVSAMRLKAEQLALVDGCLVSGIFFAIEPACTQLNLPVNIPAGTSSSDTDTEYRFLFGLGLSADITDHFVGRLDYTEYDIDTLDAFALSLSLLYKF